LLCSVILCPRSSNGNIAATSTDENATISGVGEKTLSTGENHFIITVTAQDGVTTQNYTLTITRAYNSDATLSELIIPEGLLLTPEFNSNIFNYAVDILEEVTEMTIMATPTDANAKLFGDGLKNLSSGANYFTLIVLAEDGVTSLEYSITVNRVVGINEPTQQEKKILVYPNPTTGKLRITSYGNRISKYMMFTAGKFLSRMQKEEGRKQKMYLKLTFRIYRLESIS